MEAKVDQAKPARTMTHLQVDGKIWGEILVLRLPDYDEGRVLVGQQDDPAEDEGENQGQEAVAEDTH